MKLLKRIILGAYICLAPGSVLIYSACADDVLPEPTTIQLMGLTFDCPSCFLTIAETCELVTPTERLLMRCDELADDLLLRVPVALGEPSYPTPEELMNYLLTQSPRIETAERALEILLRSERGKLLVISGAEPIALRYGGVFGKLLGEASIDRDFARRFWEQLSTTFTPPRRENLEYLLSALKQEFDPEVPTLRAVPSTARTDTTLLTAGDIIMLSVVVVFIGLILSRLFARGDRIATGADLASTIDVTDDERELQEIFSFFNLPETATESELARVYRSLAKELHPDRNCRASLASFSEIHSRYRRARALMRQRRSFIAGTAQAAAYEKRITRH